MPDMPPQAPRSRRLIVMLPLIMFGGLAALFLAQLLSGRDLAAIPSALIGSPAPVTKLAAPDGFVVPPLDSAAFIGRVTLVNVWASWCLPCRDEHPMLLALSKDKRFTMVGINYKDRPENARTFLGELGNPFGAIGADPNGRTAIDWGVYGVPETFIVGKDGKIVFKYVGPLDPASAAATLMPRIEEALAQPSG